MVRFDAWPVGASGRRTSAADLVAGLPFVVDRPTPKRQVWSLARVQALMPVVPNGCSAKRHSLAYRTLEGYPASADVLLVRQHRIGAQLGGAEVYVGARFMGGAQRMPVKVEDCGAIGRAKRGSRSRG
jgi:hypothetical protein